jgi:hypothetical protein
MAKALFRFGQECFSLDEELRKALSPLFSVVRHAYLHNVMSNEGMSCVSTKTSSVPALPWRHEIALRLAWAQAGELERVDGHLPAIAHKSLTPFMQ